MHAGAARRAALPATRKHLTPRGGAGAILTAALALQPATPPAQPRRPQPCLARSFMPIIDWTRTDLEYDWFDGSRALAFDIDDFVAFELHMLQRPGAAQQYSEELKASATKRFEEVRGSSSNARRRTPS